MIKQILDLLMSDEWHGTKSEAIEIAKGKNQLPKTFKQLKNKIKRKYRNAKWQ